MQLSCLDHITTNVPEKCNTPEVLSALSSDHHPVMVTKFSREPRIQPKTIKKRHYKNFSPFHFLLDIFDCVQNDGFKKVTDSNNIDEASAIFSGIFGTILNQHAPLKVTQVRTNYVPWISAETKKLQKHRDQLKKEAIEEQSPIKFNSYRILRNQVCNRIKSDKLNYYKNKFYSKNSSTAELWTQANNYLNTVYRTFNNSPNHLPLLGI